MTSKQDSLSRDGSHIHRRSRRTPKNPPQEKNIHRGSVSSVKQLSIDLEHGVTIAREEDRMGLWEAVLAGIARVKLMLGFSIPVEDEGEDQDSKEPVLVYQHPHRYRPNSIKELCNATGFSPAEMKQLYRGFKTECPTGVLTEECFHHIYSSFFPWGDQSYHGSICSYSHYIFSLMDASGSGVITFEDFVLTLALLLRGTEEDKLRWVFQLYDLNGDGWISREEMEDITHSVFDLLDKTRDDTEDLDRMVVKQRVGLVWQAMDKENDGLISQESFVSFCQQLHKQRE